MMMQSLDNAELFAFHRDGFIAVQELIGETEIAIIKSILLTLHEKNIGFKEGAQFDAAPPDGNPMQRRFPQILNPHIYAPALTQTGYHRISLQIAKQILGPGARFKGDISFLKPARIGSVTPWHQDEAFSNPAFDHHEISIWLAVTQANASNSCMSFIPGSHKGPILMHRPMGGDVRAHALECVVGEADEARAVECPLPAGGCTIHTERTLHYAGANPSPEARLAYVVMFDIPAVVRAVAHDFPWNRQVQSDRARREKIWFLRGGLLIYVWRRRHRIRLSLLVGKIRRMQKERQLKRLARTQK